MSDDSLDLLLGANGIGPSTLEDFEQTGFNSVNDVGKLSPEELSEKVHGVGYSTAVSVLKHLEQKGYRNDPQRDKEAERLVELLQDLFEFDAKDRDFGVYKLMNANREEIDQFIKEDLIDKIETEVASLQEKFGENNKEEIREEVIDELGADAFDGDSLSTQAITEIENRSEGISEQELEDITSDIYNHIFQFLSNYYENGDFINRRKRSHHEEPYSVPYDGSNTNFHWVTKNQYYSKTSEQFMRFTFNHRDKKIQFITKSGELDGSGVGNSEYFVMEDIENIETSGDEVKINFYRRMIGDDDLERFDISSSARNKQDKMNQVFAEELSETLSIDEDKIHEKLDEYTTRNQTDFFIHKNIDGFLNNELEEYIKSEIVSFDPQSGVDGMTDISMEKARVVNEITTDIISFVSQIEEFKRKIFEKKKFVKSSKELVQVENIPDENHETILNCENQLESWEDSYNINSSNLSIDDLKENPADQMVVDTSNFEEDITTGDEPQNKLIKGDNYQALNFLQEKYENSVKCIYIDPPYNTGNANFAYKDNYQRPTWLSMMYDRLQQSKNLLKDDGVIFVSIDYNEISRLELIMEDIFEEENKLTTFVWKRRTGANDANRNISTDHEFVVAFSKSDDFKFKGEKKSFERYTNPDNDERGEWTKFPITCNKTKAQRPNLYYTLKDPESGREYECDPDAVWRYKPETMEQLIEEDKMVFPETRRPYRKKFKHEIESKYKPISSWIENPNSDTTSEDKTILTTGMTGSGTRKVKSIFNEKVYDYPKPPELIRTLIDQSTENGDIVLDFFAGSGTTAQAVQELNRERDEQVNYVLVEMIDEAFDITEERIKRTAYKKKWKDGEPQEENTDADTEFNPDVECLELESYEESLDAIEFDSDQETLGSFNETLLNYLLEFGTKDSPVFLDTDRLSRPLEYKLDLNMQTESVDVMTTFNYLVGMDQITKTTRTIADVDYTIYDGEIDGDSAVVIWRHDAEEVDYESEADQIDTSDSDVVFINGDSSIEGSMPISNEFKRKMIGGDNL